MTQAWILGKQAGDDAWVFCGVFLLEAQAREACTHPDHFIGPVVLDAVVPDEPTPWVGAYRPSDTTPDKESPR